jgi:hypothetical protein
VLGVSVGTVGRELRLGQAWLRRELSRQSASTPISRHAGGRSTRSFSAQWSVRRSRDMISLSGSAAATQPSEPNWSR